MSKEVSCLWRDYYWSKEWELRQKVPVLRKDKQNIESLSSILHYYFVPKSIPWVIFTYQDLGRNWTFWRIWTFAIGFPLGSLIAPHLEGILDGSPLRTCLFFWLLVWNGVPGCHLDIQSSELLWVSNRLRLQDLEGLLMPESGGHSSCCRALSFEYVAAQCLATKPY